MLAPVFKLGKFFAEPKMSGASSRQSQMVADEMFPDGPGPLDFVDVEDGVRRRIEDNMEEIFGFSTR